MPYPHHHNPHPDPHPPHVTIQTTITHTRQYKKQKSWMLSELASVSTHEQPRPPHSDDPQGPLNPTRGLEKAP